MEFEGVGSVAMSGVSFEVLREVDDVDCLKWTFFDANTTSDTERF
jgi:hypothetical protein